jgi:hypothetical protein
MVEPVDPLQRRVFHVVDRSPRPDPSGGDVSSCYSNIKPFLMLMSPSLSHKP